MSGYDLDIKLVEQLKAGDKNAFIELYESNREWLIVVALSVLGNEDEMEAQDVVQQFFIDLWDRKLFNNIIEGKALKSYLHRSVYNRCLDLIKRKNQLKSHKEAFALTIVEWEFPKLPSLENMENEIKDKEIQALLQEGIKAMSSNCAKVFELAYMQQKSRSQIAAELGKTPNTVKNQLVQALKILRKTFKKSKHSF